MVCGQPVFWVRSYFPEEPHWSVQHRDWKRFCRGAAPREHRFEGDDTNFHLRTQDISSSGIALVSQIDLPEKVEVGESIIVNIDTKTGKIDSTCRVIRIEKNWLANKTVLGVEMTDMDDDSSDNLMKLLALLGLENKFEDDNAATTGKLFGWKGDQRGQKEDRSFLRKTGEITPPDAEPS